MLSGVFVCMRDGMHVHQFVCVCLIDQLWPLLEKKLIPLGTKWWMANSGSHVRCVCVERGEG